MSASDEPSGDRLDPEEPHTPFWLTLLGGALFLAGAIFLLGTSGEDDASGSPAEEATAPEIALDQPAAED